MDDRCGVIVEPHAPPSVKPAQVCDKEGTMGVLQESTASHCIFGITNCLVNDCSVEMCTAAMGRGCVKRAAVMFSWVAKLFSEPRSSILTRSERSPLRQTARQRRFRTASAGFCLKIKSLVADRQTRQNCSCVRWIRLGGPGRAANPLYRPLHAPSADQCIHSSTAPFSTS